MIFINVSRTGELGESVVVSDEVSSTTLFLFPAFSLHTDCVEFHIWHVICLYIQMILKNLNKQTAAKLCKVRYQFPVMVCRNNENRHSPDGSAAKAEGGGRWE